MLVRRSVIMALIFALSACAGPVRTKSNVNPKVEMKGYRSFSWISDKPLVQKPGGKKIQPANPVVEKQIQSAIAENLRAKGYALADNRADADFHVAFTVGSREQLQVTSVPAGYHPYYRGGVGYRRFNRYYDAPVIRTQADYAKTYTEGVLAIDVFDVKTKQPAWHGYSTKAITSSDQKNPGPIIQEVVASTLDDFPPVVKTGGDGQKTR